MSMSMTITSTTITTYFIKLKLSLSEFTIPMLLNISLLKSKIIQNSSDFSSFQSNHAVYTVSNALTMW